VNASRTEDAMEPGGANHLLPRGSLTVSAPRELLVVRSLHGAYEPDGTIAGDTPHTISLAGFVRPFPMPDAPTAEEVVRVHEGDVVWAGSVADQYGHFLTESVGRLWPLLPGAELEGLPVVLTTPQDSPFVLDWLRAFGVEAIELPEKGAVRFSRMFVPEHAWRLDNWIAPEIRDIHLHARRNLDLPPTPRHDVLWLSRSKLESGRIPYDECLLEWLLGDRVTSICPETLPLAEQVAVFEGCRAVAGVIGSAFHTLLMVEDLPECLYLCPPWDKGTYPAQHRVLNADAVFRPALEIAAHTRTRREKEVFFPRGYRLLVPETLRALGETVLPSLSEDPRLAAFARLESGRPQDDRHSETELDAAAMGVLLDPYAIEPRRRLGELFEAAGHARCAREQFSIVADLAGDHSPGLTR
jgi:hypothetical protein